jgi:hypothetical protein
MAHLAHRVLEVKLQSGTERMSATKLAEYGGRVPYCFDAKRHSLAPQHLAQQSADLARQS